MKRDRRETTLRVHPWGPLQGLCALWLAGVGTALAAADPQAAGHREVAAQALPLQVATGVDTRVDRRQERRQDAVENTGDRVQDKHEFREQRRDCTGEGPDCRADNRQDKRQDTVDRAQDRTQDRRSRR